MGVITYINKLGHFCLKADSGKVLTDGTETVNIIESMTEFDISAWQEIDAPQNENPTAYTAEQLSEMTNAELSAILADMGISGSMTKANMIALILDKQNSIA